MSKTSQNTSNSSPDEGSDREDYETLVRILATESTPGVEHADLIVWIASVYSGKPLKYSQCFICDKSFSLERLDAHEVECATRWLAERLASGMPINFSSTVVLAEQT